MNNYTTGNTILYLDQVELGYGEGSEYKMILKNITIEEKDVVGTGQCIAVVGRSGRGKSTLFKALTGMVKPRSGKILISEDEKDTKAKEVNEGDIGYVDQKYTLFRHKTVYQALHSASRKNKLQPKEREDLIHKYLGEWGLMEHKDKYPCELSGGQRQRTAIIEQILSSGHFMVLDEPFSGLDVGNIRNVKNAFELIHKGHELNTIIFSTHDIRLAVELADSIYVIGFPDEKREFSTVISHYDLKKLGLAWQKLGPSHLELLEKIESDLMKS
jgi:ABC-type nitrate/sulfonate/bicarbonate transport system ATPase subunit